MQIITNAMVGVSGAPGTGTITLGAAIGGGQTWAAAGAVNGAAYGYRIDDGQNWEIGAGTYTASGTTLTRGPLFSTAASNGAITATANAVVSQIALPSDLQLALGFSPVQQGGGTGMTGTAQNKLVLGWNTAGTALLAQVDATALGKVWTDNLAVYTGNANGSYWKLPNGLILQMQRLSLKVDAAYNWPVTFPNGVLAVQATVETADATATTSYAVQLDQISASQYAVRPRVTYGGTTTQPPNNVTVNILGLGT